MKTLKHLLTALLLMVATVAMAHDFEVGGIYYSILYGEEKTVEVTCRGNFPNSYSNEYTGSVDIPSMVTYNDLTYSVTSIGFGAFDGCSGLTSITIPNSVTSIGHYAFDGCSGLTSVTIPNSVTSIGYSAFRGTAWYNNLSDGVVYAGKVLYTYKGTMPENTNISIKEGTLGIADEAFRACYGLTSVTIPNSVTNIGNRTFSGCTGLTSIEIPNSVTSIGDYAFSGCSGLTSVTIGNGVTSIGNYAFDECTNLKELRIEDGGTILYLGWNSTNKGLFYDCPLETLYLGRDLSYITSPSYYSPFYNIKTLKNVTISNSVTSIGSSAFYGCSGLTSVTIPNSVTSIGSDAFFNCSNLNKAIWLTNTPPTGYKNVGATINYVANDQYSGLSNVKVYPYLSSLFEVGGVKYVPVSPAERTCDAIDCVYDSTAVDINIEKTVLFKGIAMNVKQVMPYTFYANKNIKTIKVENDGIVGNYAFNGCTSLATATISNNGGIGDYAFSYCSSLITATLGDSIASIGASAFYGCSKLSEIVIPDAVTTIGSSVFRNCTSLETVKVGNGTKSIDSYAFYACSSLPEIVIPQSVTKINSYAFDNCTALADVIIEDRTTALSLGSNGYSPLFSDCPLDSVYIGGKITYGTSSSYGYSPFYRNTSLRSVVITDTEEEVYDNEFYGCSNLKNVSIGNGVKKIGNWAFSGCSAIDYFAFGNSVQSIGEEAFSDCNNVTKLISSASTPPVCGTQALDDINKWNCTLYVPNESKSAYQSAEQWKEFFFVEDLPTAIVSVLPDYKIQDPVYYDLQGRKVDNPTNGIYIVNGKKVFVK